MLIRSFAPLLLVACIDQPVEIAPRTGGPPTSRLSELGLFDDLPSLRPAAGVVSYDVIAPLWSDGASKSRLIAAPTDHRLTAGDDRWEIPDGTYLVKTFFFPRDARDPSLGRQLLETRVIAFTTDSVAQATFVWNAEQTDAVSSGGNLDLAVRWIDETGAPREQTHHVPGTSQCGSCHRGGSDSLALGIRTPELAIAGQLDALVAAGVVDRAPPPTTPFVDPYGDAALDARATSYLEMNCAHCHSPGGEAASTKLDWRRDHVADAICRSTPSIAGRTRVIVPGAPGESALLARMTSTNPFQHMPRGPSHVPDDRAIAMLGAWISALSPAGCP